MRVPGPWGVASRSWSSVLLAAGRAHGCVISSGGALHRLPLGVLPTVGLLPAAFLAASTREEVYNVLWALVFGFATLNILSLGARRFDPRKSGLNFGEVLAVLVVLVSVLMLGWEMLYVFQILPIRLAPQ